MKPGKLFSIIMVVVFALSLVPAFTSISDTVFAQISPLPTHTPTPVGPPPTPTDTPLPPTPTDTPLPPTPTDTPLPPTPTDTPLPPTPTDTPAPPTPTPLPLPPELGFITTDPPDAVVAVGDDFDVIVVFAIANTVDLDAATWDWGDGSISTCPANSAACTVDPGDGRVGMVTGSHTYNETGVYRLQSTVVDIFGQFDTSTFEFVVVYDPNGGFVTGGGWIASQVGAYKPDPFLTGKASFGFVSKYKKGTTVPTGNTEFQFQVADLNFHSDTYQWLVVNQGGANAQFKGEGTINGAVSPGGDNYQFMVWATDGTPDTFRIKIWYMDGDTMTVVYDNGVGRAIGGGNIVVHKAKGGR